MIIILKTFTKKEKTPSNKSGKDYRDWREFLQEHFSGEVEKEKRKRNGGKQKDSKPASTKTVVSNTKPDNNPPTRTKKDIALQNKIDRTNKEIELEEKRIKLKDLKNIDEPDRIDKVKEKAKSIIENPKFKKGAKIAGLSALGAGITVGAILGGRKIKQKIDEKNSNNRIKKSIMEDPEKEEQ